MKTITLTEEELNECLQAVQDNREITHVHDELVSVQLPKDDYILNIVTKDGELVLMNIAPKDGELVLFNITTKEGKLLFDEEVIFMFIFGDVIKAGRKNGEVIEIDNIISK